MKEAKKVKEKTLAKEKVKDMFETKSPQEAAGHNSGPLKQTILYCGSECNFKWKEISNFQVIKWTKNKKVKKKL